MYYSWNCNLGRKKKLYVFCFARFFSTYFGDAETPPWIRSSAAFFEDIWKQIKLFCETLLIIDGNFWDNCHFECDVLFELMVKAFICDGRRFISFSIILFLWTLTIYAKGPRITWFYLFIYIWYDLWSLKKNYLLEAANRERQLVSCSYIWFDHDCK
jgi:hypothetical protein